MDRAQDLYSAMLLRGYHGHFHYAPLRSFSGGDACFAAVSAAIFIVLRFVPLARMIGGFVI